MNDVQRPATVLVPASDYDFDRLTDAALGWGTCIPQIIQSAQDIVVPKRRKRKAEPALVDHFARLERTKHAALEQVVLGPPAGLADGRRFAPCSFVIE